MSAIRLPPDLSESLGNKITHGIGRVAELCRSQIESLLPMFSYSESADLMGGLALWQAGMKPEVMDERYTLMRQLIRVVGEIIRDNERL